MGNNLTINIGVTGTGSLIGQAIIKSLKRSEIGDINIIGFDYFANTVGSFWCKYNVILPDILSKEVSEAQFLDKLTDAIIKYKITFLFIGLDFELALFSKYKNIIFEKTKCKVIVSDEKVIAIGNDKYNTYSFLKDNNLFYPKSFIDPDKALAELDFPILIKPRIGARSRGVVIVNNRKEFFDKLAITENPIIQEYIGSKDYEFTCGVITHCGIVKDAIILRRDLKDGNTYIAEYKKEYDTYRDYIMKVASILKPEGSSNFQFRLDKNCNPIIFEINPRHSGTTYMRLFFGYNEVDIILGHHLGIELNRKNYKEGIVIRYYDELFIESKHTDK